MALCFGIVTSLGFWTWRRWWHACVYFLRPTFKLVLLHVDDLLVVGDYSFIELQLLPVLKAKYKLSLDVMKEPGDEVNFLRRNHILISKTEMVIYPHA